MTFARYQCAGPRGHLRTAMRVAPLRLVALAPKYRCLQPEKICAVPHLLAGEFWLMPVDGQPSGPRIIIAVDKYRDIVMPTCRRALSMEGKPGLAFKDDPASWLAGIGSSRRCSWTELRRPGG